MDAAYARAVAEGATPVDGPEDKHYGERSAAFRDAFGNTWYVSTYQGNEG